MSVVRFELPDVMLVASLLHDWVIFGALFVFRRWFVGLAGRGALVIALRSVKGLIPLLWTIKTAVLHPDRLRDKRQHLSSIFDTGGQSVVFCLHRTLVLALPFHLQLRCSLLEWSFGLCARLIVASHVPETLGVDFLTHAAYSFAHGVILPSAVSLALDQYMHTRDVQRQRTIKQLQDHSGKACHSSHEVHHHYGTLKRIQEPSGAGSCCPPHSQNMVKGFQLMCHELANWAIDQPKAIYSSISAIQPMLRTRYNYLRDTKKLRSKSPAVELRATDPQPDITQYHEPGGTKSDMPCRTRARQGVDPRTLSKGAYDKDASIWDGTASGESPSDLPPAGDTATAASVSGAWDCVDSSDHQSDVAVVPDAYATKAEVRPGDHTEDLASPPRSERVQLDLQKLMRLASKPSSAQSKTCLYTPRLRTRLISVKVPEHPSDFNRFSSMLTSQVQSAVESNANEGGRTVVSLQTVCINGCVQLLMVVTEWSAEDDVRQSSLKLAPGTSLQLGADEEECTQSAVESSQVWSVHRLTGQPSIKTGWFEVSSDRDNENPGMAAFMGEVEQQEEDDDLVGSLALNLSAMPGVNGVNVQVDGHGTSCPAAGSEGASSVPYQSIVKDLTALGEWMSLKMFCSRYDADATVEVVLPGLGELMGQRSVECIKLVAVRYGVVVKVKVLPVEQLKSSGVHKITLPAFDDSGMVYVHVVVDLEGKRSVLANTLPFLSTTQDVYEELYRWFGAECSDLLAFGTPTTGRRLRDISGYTYVNKVAPLLHDVGSLLDLARGAICEAPPREVLADCLDSMLAYLAENQFSQTISWLVSKLVTGQQAFLLEAVEAAIQTQVRNADVDDVFDDGCTNGCPEWMEAGQQEVSYMHLQSRHAAYAAVGCHPQALASGSSVSVPPAMSALVEDSAHMHCRGGKCHREEGRDVAVSSRDVMEKEKQRKRTVPPPVQPLKLGGNTCALKMSEEDPGQDLVDIGPKGRDTMKPPGASYSLPTETEWEFVEIRRRHSFDVGFIRSAVHKDGPPYSTPRREDLSCSGLTRRHGRVVDSAENTTGLVSHPPRRMTEAREVEKTTVAPQFGASEVMEVNLMSSSLVGFPDPVAECAYSEYKKRLFSGLNYVRLSLCAGLALEQVLFLHMWGARLGAWGATALLLAPMVISYPVLMRALGSKPCMQRHEGICIATQLLMVLLVLHLDVGIMQPPGAAGAKMIVNPMARAWTKIIITIALVCSFCLQVRFKAMVAVQVAMVCVHTGVLMFTNTYLLRVRDSLSLGLATLVLGFMVEVLTRRQFLQGYPMAVDFH